MKIQIVVMALLTISSAADAAQLINRDTSVAVLTAEVEGRKQTLKLLPGYAYDSQGKEARFTLGNNASILAKPNDRWIIQRGHFEIVEDQDAVPAPSSERPAPFKSRY